jgi:hypothetical protein
MLRHEFAENKLLGEILGADYDAVRSGWPATREKRTSGEYEWEEETAHHD